MSRSQNVEAEPLCMSSFYVASVMKVWGEPPSSMAMHRSDVVGVAPQYNLTLVVNEVSSITPLTKYGPLSDKNGALLVVWTSLAWSFGTCLE